MLSKQSLVGGHLVPRSRRTRNCRSSGIVSKGSKPSELRPALISPRLPELSTHLDTHLSCSASRTPRRLITRGTELKRAAESSEVARCLRFDRRGKNTTGTNNAAQNPLFARHPCLFHHPIHHFGFTQLSPALTQPSLHTSYSMAPSTTAKLSQRAANR